MSRNIKKARIARISKVKADRSLEERVIALEKQLNDMQAAMSCGSKMVRIASGNFEQSIKATLSMG
ncbi:hypothetical protein J6836_07740 [Providencia sp. R33]|uniref:hypothetical protein n=1 Tax=Providencia sp. R33 TaxID=2828763 RepID=UPI001C5AB1DA|nr:hypothetical protein [Providencia sp. R33]QXX84254.1 hypothetical protein J6836_07740 [Providencia sp. R33]